MQERMLSPRTIDSGVTLSFECRQGSCEEFNSIERSSPTVQDQGKARLAAWPRGGEQHGRHFESLLGSFWSLWHEIVEFYTGADFTIHTDRPVAILESCNASSRQLIGITSMASESPLGVTISYRLLLIARAESPFPRSQHVPHLHGHGNTHIRS